MEQNKTRGKRMITSIEWFCTPSHPAKSSQLHTSPPKHARAKTKTLMAPMASKNQGESDRSLWTKISKSIKSGVVAAMRQLSRFMEEWVASPLLKTMEMYGRILRIWWRQVAHPKGQVSPNRSLKYQLHQALTAKRITLWFAHPRAWLSQGKTCLPSTKSSQQRSLATSECNPWMP